MLYKLSHGSNQNICCAKDEDTVNHHALTRWFKKFFSGCKNLYNQASASRSKGEDSEVVLQDMETNLASSTQRVSGEIGSNSPGSFVTSTTSGKVSQAAELCPTLPRYHKTFDSPK